MKDISKIFSQYSNSDEFSELIEDINLLLAFLNSKKEVVWCSSKFHSLLNNSSLQSFLNQPFNNEDINSVNSKTIEIIEPKISLKLQPLHRSGKLIGFVINEFNVGQENIDHHKIVKSIAHDFNNIFTSILSSVELLKNKIPSDLNISYLIENIENNSARAAEIIEDILAPAGSESKTIRKINLSSLINELVGAIKQTLPKYITLRTDVQKDLDQVYGKYHEFFRVLMNLCVNAKEAINDKGEIIISAANVSLDDEYVDGKVVIPPGKYVLISLKDNGSGIDENNIDKLFEQNFTTKHKKRESGIGLGIVKEIISNYDGIITVNSKKNVGTEFKIYLQAAVKKEKSSFAANDKTILIAEDEELLQDLLTELLESYNYNVITSSNGKQALEKLNNNTKVDLIIIDKKMPEMNGIELIEEINSMGLDIPIVLASGSPSDKNNVQIKKLKVDRILNKPYNFEKLLDLIHELVG
jgi:signal transduction histidine kinase